MIARQAAEDRWVALATESVSQRRLIVDYGEQDAQANCNSQLDPALPTHTRGVPPAAAAAPPPGGAASGAAQRDGAAERDPQAEALLADQQWRVSAELCISVL